MPYRSGDPTVELEARIEVTTSKAYLIEPTMGSKRQVWLPKSQTISMTEPTDGDGNRTFVVTEWWYKRAELDE